MGVAQVIARRKRAAQDTGVDAPPSLLQLLKDRLGGGDGDHKGFLRGAGIAFILQGLGAGVAFAMQVLLGRWMGATDFGTYSYTVAWAGLVAVATGLGLPSTVLRFVPAFASHKDWPRLRGVLNLSFLITIAASAGVAAIATAVVVLLGGGDPNWVVVLGLWLAPLLALRTLQQEVVRAFHRIGLAYGPGMVLRPAFVILGAAAYVALGNDLTSEAALCITVAGIAVILAGQDLFFWHRLEPAVKKAKAVYETRAWMAVALPLLLIASFSVVLQETDIVMVGSFLGAKEAGIYTAASKTAAIVGMVLISVNAIAAPMFSSLFAQGRKEQLALLAARVANWLFWPTLLLCILLAIGAEPILSLFGEQFEQGRWILIVLLVSQLVSAAVGSVGYLMTQTGHQREAAWVYGWVAVGHVGLNLIAIPLFGAIGAAIATSTSLSVWNVWLHALVVRRLGIHPSVFAQFRRRPQPGPDS